MTVIGYGMMASGEDTYSVVILIVAYVILFPASILMGIKRKSKESDDKD